MSDCSETIKTRRSVRRYTEEAVDQLDLDEILDAARRAPSGGNRQAWLFIAVRNRAVLKKTADIVSSGIEALRTLHPRASAEEIESLQGRYRKFSLFHTTAPVAIFVFYNPYVSRTMTMLEAEGLSEAEAERQSGYVEVQSAAAAVQNLLLEAHSRGYGACWMNPPHFAKDGISRLLDMHDPFRLMAIVPIGRPAERPVASQRKNTEEVIRFVD